MRVMKFGLFVLACVGLLAATPTAKLAGRWTARTMMAPFGSEAPVPTTFTFIVDGEKLMGTVSSPRGEYEILAGRVDGDLLTFNILVSVDDSRLKLLYDGKITEEGLDFISKFENGDRSDHFVAKPVPD